MDFWRLVHNENLKIVLKKSTWILTILMIIGSPIVPIFLKLIDIPFSAPDVIYQSFNLYFIVIMLSLIIASESVSSEFSRGTIKLLLIRPWDRWKILLSKYISVILFSLAATIVFVVLNIIFAYILFPASGNSILSAASSTPDLVLTVVYNYIRTLVLITVAFMLSSLFRSTALSITISILLYFSGNTLNGIFRLFLEQEHREFIKYLLSTNLDLTQYFASPTGTFGMTSLGFSLGVLLVYMIVFIAITWFSFVKRDVRA